MPIKTKEKKIPVDVVEDNPKLSTDDLLPDYDYFLELRSKHYDLDRNETEIRVEATSKGFADIRGILNPLGALLIIDKVLREVLPLLRKEMNNRDEQNTVLENGTAAELKKKEDLDILLCVHQALEILPNLVVERIREIFPEVAGEALIQALHNLKGRLSFTVPINLQKTLRDHFELFQKMKKQNRDFPKRGGPRRQRTHLETEQEQTHFKNRVDDLRQLWNKAIGIFEELEYDPECLNMLKARTDLSSIDRELLKKAYSDRKQLKEGGYNIPDKLGPFSFALKQAAHELGIKKQKDRDYSFETLRKRYRK
jgi:uncharacterized protein (UPF0335 family)